MIYKLTGKVEQVDENIISVTMTNGVSYEVICTLADIEKFTADNNDKTVYTYLQVREDALVLFGFSNLSIKAMFLKLISVSGIGPKIGIGILSGMRVCDLATAIATSDVKTLSKIKGLGKKSAERIILELRESVSVGEIGEVKKVAPAEKPLSKDEEDAIVALMGLGFNGTQAKNAVKYAREQGAITIEQTISFALQSLNR